MVNLTLEPPPSPSRPRASSGLPLLAAIAAGLLLVGGAAGFWIGRATAPRPVTAVVPSPSPSPSPSPESAAGAMASSPPTATPTPTPTATAPAPATATAAPPPTAAPPAPETPATVVDSAVHPEPFDSAASGGSAQDRLRAADEAARSRGAARQGEIRQRRVAVTVNGALEDSIARALPREERAVAEELTQVVNRLLVWDLQVARDGRRGDRLEIVWAKPDGSEAVASSEPVVEAVRYVSQKLGRSVEAYRFRADGAPWPRYYRPDGSEVEERLVDGPIREYDQVTSLLRDGRRHEGIDFRTPTGTAVFAPFDGEIVRRNWNWSANGNCLELRDLKSGRRAIFLHLDVLPRDMTKGRQVRKGERIASSGNSGRSFAPHLHYQLESADGRVLDPFEVHGATRIALDGASRSAFQASRARLGNLLGK